jgi:hypothetical protein
VKLTRENRSTRGEKTCPIVTLSITNPTWTDLGSKPGLRFQRLNGELSSQDSGFEPKVIKVNFGIYKVAAVEAFSH